MPPRDWRLRIEDMLEAIGRIQTYTKGMSLDSFVADARTMDAVARNFEIIGEAARHIPQGVQSRYPQLPWLEMRDMRNVVTHAYFRVDPVILWHSVEHDLPPLVSPLTAILREESQ